MIWCFSQYTRLRSEKAKLAELEGSVDWLVVDEWRFNTDLEMYVNFRISHDGEEMSFQMIYPGVFPDAPPMVYTKDHNQISPHQYGAEGELCLEYRPDNWVSTITGADMVGSCQRLLSEERQDADTVAHARSAHVASLGRDLRLKTIRFLVFDVDLKALNALDERTGVRMTLSGCFTAGAYVSSLQRLGDKEAPLWSSEMVLPDDKRLEDSGYVVRVPGGKKSQDNGIESLRAFLESVDLGDLAATLIDVDAITQLLIGDGETWELFLFSGKATERKAIPYTTVRVPTVANRTPEEFKLLLDKKVGIVGCGSIGSKIAASLCRSGVGEFLLIDEDIFFPGNVVRNELSLRQSGAHKSYGLRERLQDLNPNCRVIALPISLGGQESAASMSNALESLGDCDLLIDATASSRAFNMIASVAVRKKKPMVWAEVFAGGIGGLVARARPDVDPVPLSARAQLDNWCHDQDVEWVRPENADQYVGEGEDGQPLIAGDAEVSVIASHASRFSIDILSRPESSAFPVSGYIIGMSSEWLFKEPYDTRPINLEPEGAWNDEIDVPDLNEFARLLMEHMPAREDDDETSAPK